MNDFRVLRGEEAYLKANGTSLREFVQADYYDIKEIFGEPTYRDEVGEKVSIQWIIDFGDGELTIYDWKYYNADRAIMHCRNWHIGGLPEHQFQARDLVAYIYNQKQAAIDRQTNRFDKYNGKQGWIMPDDYLKAIAKTKGQKI